MIYWNKKHTEQIQNKVHFSHTMHQYSQHKEVQK